jgi:hypothetical protein
MPDVADLLAEFTVVLNTHGVASPEVEAFLELHKDNAEFVELAELACLLKRALCP